MGWKVEGGTSSFGHTSSREMGVSAALGSTYWWSDTVPNKVSSPIEDTRPVPEVEQVVALSPERRPGPSPGGPVVVR